MAYVIERPLINDVAPVWVGVEGKALHAVMIESGAAYRFGRYMADGRKAEALALLPEALTTACKRPLERSKVGGAFKPCKSCTAQFQAEPKKGTGLSESKPDLVAMGNATGTPADDERAVAAEVLEISGDAGVRNAGIVESLRAGDVEGALESAHALDVRGPAAPVPTAPSQATGRGRMAGRSVREAGLSVGARGEAQADGTAFIPGGNMAPVQPQRGWIAKAGTGALPAGVGKAVPDRGATGEQMYRHDPVDNATCKARQCSHRLYGLPADVREAVTYRELSELAATGPKGKNRANKLRGYAKRAAEELKRGKAYERACGRVDVLAGADAEVWARMVERSVRR